MFRVVGLGVSGLFVRGLFVFRVVGFSLFGSKGCEGLQGMGLGV